MEYILPKGYISYSAWSLWKRDKNAFRRRYYENEKPPETVETIFGKRIAELLEDNHDDLSHVPRYECPEHSIAITIEGVKILGYIDNFCPHTFSFLEYKTGHKDKNGKEPWNKLKVEKHEQLPFYSMLIKEKYGKVKNTCHLIWLETEFINKTIEFDGHTLTADTRELKLTGKVKKFSRTIYEWQRKKIKKELLQAVKEIHEDYEKYRSTRISQALSQETPEKQGVL